MRYLLLHCLDESAEVSPADDSDVPGSPAQIAQDAWDAEMDERGIRRFSARLRPAAQARSVRVRNGEVLVSDGPFAETKEQIAGVNILHCADLDEAIEVASRHPTAKIGTFELRPMLEQEE
jgi:hypothetical protein